MRSQSRLCPALVLGWLFVLAPGCGQDRTPGPAAVAPSPPPPARNEIPGDRLEAALEAHFRGVGFMEQYEYSKAVAEFRKVHELAPGWIPGAVNLAIALLNDTGSQDEAAKTGEDARF